MNNPCSQAGCRTAALRSELDEPRRKVARILKPYDPGRAALIDDCGRAIRSVRCRRCGSARELGRSCGVFGCPFCDVIHGAGLAAKLLNCITPKANHVFLTVAWPNIPLVYPFGLAIQRAVNSLLDAFAALRRSTLLKTAVSGGFWRLEHALSVDPRSPSGRSIRPHLHALMDSEYIGITQVQELWLRLSGSRSCDVRHAYAPAGLARYFSESLKWAELSEELPAHVPAGALLATLQDVRASRRLYSTFGTWHGRSPHKKNKPAKGRGRRRCFQCNAADFEFEYRRPSGSGPQIEPDDARRTPPRGDSGGSAVADASPLALPLF